MIRSRSSLVYGQAQFNCRDFLLLGGVDMVLTLIITVPFNKQDKQELLLVGHHHLIIWMKPQDWRGSSDCIDRAPKRSSSMKIALSSAPSLIPSSVPSSSFSSSSKKLEGMGVLVSAGFTLLLELDVAGVAALGWACKQRFREKYDSKKRRGQQTLQQWM